jgi:iron complex outermembrane recepter protein
MSAFCHRYRGHALGVLSLFCCATANAQPSAPDTAASAPPGEPSSSQTITVTGQRGQRGYQSFKGSTATKTDTPLIDTPQAITVVPREVLQDQAATELAEAVRNVSGVSREASYWGREGDSFRIRGFALSDEHGYYKDGFRYNAKGTLVMNNVERVEVLKGPASVLYGRGEPGGLINLVTQAPSRQRRDELELSLGRWNNLGLSGSSTGVLGDAASSPWLYRIDASADSGDSFRDSVFHRTLSIASTVHWQPSPGTTMSLASEAVWDQRRPDYGIPGLRGRPAQVPINTYYGEAFNDQESRQGRLAAGIDHRLNDRWRVKGQLSWYRLQYPIYNDVYAGAVDSDNAQLLMFWEDLPDRYDNRFAQIDLIGRLSTGPLHHTLLVGAELGRQLNSQDGAVFGDYFAYDIFNPQRRGANVPQGNTITSNYRLDTRSQGLYLQDQMDIGEHFKLLAGLRYDRYRQDYLYEPLSPQDETITGPRAQTQTRDEAVSPRLGLLLKPMEELSLYASLSRSFAPAFPFAQAQQGTRFKPERGALQEVGLKWEGADGKLSLTAAVYDLRKRNVVNVDPDNPLFSIQNGEEGSRGVEVDLAAQPLRGLNVIASFAWMRARLNESTDFPVGNTLPLAPMRSGSLWLSYAWQHGADARWSVGGGVFHQSERFTDLFNDTVLPAYTRIDLSAGLTIDSWKLQLNLKNAANRRLFESSNATAVIFPSPPRNLQLTLGRHW